MNFLLDDPIINIFFAIIAGVFILCICVFHYFPQNRLYSIANQGSSLLVTLGILGTFVGISIALTNFDTSNINQAIPLLLSGLKTAFYTSVAGLLASLIFRVIKSCLSKDKSAGDSHAVLVQISDNIVDVRDALIGEGDASLSTQMSKVRDALIGEGDASLSTQIGKLRLDFQSFAEKITKDSSKALIEALENVIKDFNAKINEQFGENFKRLNEAVGKLLAWQIEYKQQVQELTAIFEEAKTGIVVAQESITKIEKSSSKIPEQMAKIAEVFELTDTRMKELYNGLSSLAELRLQAEAAVPFLQKQFETMTGNFKTIADDFQASVAEQLTAIQTTQSEFQDNNKAELEKITEGFATTNKDIQGMLSKSTTDTSEMLNKSVASLDQIIKDKLTVIQTTQSEFQDNNKAELEKITEGFATTNKDIQGMLNKSVASLDQIIKDKLTAIQTTQSEFQDNNKAELEKITEGFATTNKDIQGMLSKSTTDTSEMLNKSVASLDQIIKEQLTAIQATQSEFQDNNKAELKKITEGFATTNKDIQGMLSKSTTDTSEMLTGSILELSEKIEGQISKSTQTTSEMLNQSIQQLDSSMEKELERALNRLGNSLIAITTKLVKSYEEHSEHISSQLDKRQS